MRTRLLLSVILLGISVNVFGQNIDSVIKQLEQKYSFACYHDIYGGWISVKNNGKEGACDLQGREVIPPQYDDVRFRGSYYEVKKDGKVAIRDLHNNELLGFIYDEVRWWLIEYGYCQVKLNGKWGVVDKNGREVIPPLYDETYVYTLKSDYYEVELNGKRGVVDKNGREVIPPKYDYVDSYMIKDKGYAFLKEQDKYGIWNIALGRETVSCVYDSVSTVSTKDYYIVKSNLKWGVINSQGTTVVPINYEYIGVAIDCDYCQVAKNIEYQDGYVTKTYQYIPPKVIKNGKWGIYDMKNNKQIVPCDYEYIGFPSEGLITFNVNGNVTGLMPGKVNGGKWGYLDILGNIVIKPEYDDVYAFKDGVAQVTKNNVTSIISNPLTGTSLQIANGYSHSSAVDVNIPENGNANPELFAFIFANENYTDFSGADYAIRDGKTMKEYCRKTLGVPDNNIRYYEDATYGNISSALKKIQDIAEVYDGDAKIIFYFAGLGMTDEKTKERYLLPSDASKASIAATGIRVSTIIDMFNEFDTVYSLILLDAPFSGTDRKGNMLASSRGVRISAKNDTEPQGAAVVCTSGSNDDISYCDEQAGHGLFTYVLLSKLQETKGNCTIKELLEKTLHQTKQSSLQNFNTVQSPEIRVSQDIENRWQSLKF